MLLIYSPQSSSRLEYVLQLFFDELIQTNYRLTINEQEFELYRGPKLNYSKKRFGNENFLYSTDLLFENGIREQEISVGIWKGIKTIFAHQIPNDLPFDPFAAAFYLTSRYEEYLPFTPDAHAR